MAKELAERLKPIREKIEVLEREMDDLSRKLGEATASRKHLIDVYMAMGGVDDLGGPVPPPTSIQGDETTRRTRTPHVKVAVIDIMRAAGAMGRTSAEVLAEINAKGLMVSRDTISSVLSRLKADGALAHDGLRYHEASHAPKPGDGKPPHIRAVS